jgi:hypothetical protein
LIIESVSGWDNPGETSLELVEAENLGVRWVFQFPGEIETKSLSDIKYFELGFFRHGTPR